jgi:Insertion element 4 transposase N-terminal/Transposase DDE domain
VPVVDSKFDFSCAACLDYCSAVTDDGLGAEVPAGASLPDKVALGVLTRLVTRELVEDVLAETGRKEQRKRLLPARAVVYFVLSLALFSGDCYEEVMRELVQGLSWLAIWKRDWEVPTASALAQARKRLGAEPVRQLYRRVAVPCAMRSTAGAWIAGRRLMAIDGVELDAADTPANAEFFGYSSGKGGSTGPFPKVLVVALAECGTHAITAVETGGGDDSESPLARQLAAAPGNLEPGMLVTADRGLYSYELCSAVTAARADFCLRAPAQLQLPVLAWLPDGSYRSYIASPRAKGTPSNRAKLAAGVIAVTDLPGIPVRVVDYTVPGRGEKNEIFTVITSVLDHQDLAAADLAAAYRQRWEIELAFNEIETRQRGPAVILRSRSPDLVLQELYGLLITHYAIRRLMTEAADQAELDPDQLSFTRTLRIVRRQVTAQAAFSPLPPDPRHG